VQRNRPEEVPRFFRSFFLTQFDGPAQISPLYRFLNSCIRRPIHEQ
jgi:hypothetical protein